MSRNRNTPRNSITKQAEYTVCTSAARRRAILRDQKWPKPFIAANYREAYAAFADVLIQGGGVRQLDAVVAEWRARCRAPRHDFEADCLALCIDAAAAFRPLLADGTFDDLDFQPGMTEAYLDIAGVKLSVRPDALIVGRRIGAVKLYLAKSSPLTEDEERQRGSAPYAATLLHQWAQENFDNVAASRCLVVDVFAQRAYEAPTRYVQRRADILAACQEIALVWPSITDPRAPRGGAPRPTL